MFQLKFIWKNLEGYRGKFIAGVLFAIINSSIILMNPYLSEMLVDDAIRGDHREWLVPILLGMSGYVLLRTGIRYLMVVMLDQSSQGMIVRIREHVFHNLQHQEMRFYDRNRNAPGLGRKTAIILGRMAGADVP